MVITFGIDVMDANTALVPYKSEEACGQAIMPVYDTLHDTFPDLVIQCVETEQLSSTLRPMPRPENLQ